MIFPGKRSLILGLIFLCGLPVHGLAQRRSAAGYSIDAPPSWVQPINAATVKSSNLNGERALQHILKDVQVRVSTPARTTSYSHMAFKPATAASLEHASKITIHFNPKYQSLTLHDVALVRNGRRIDKLGSVRTTIGKLNIDSNVRIDDGTVTASMDINDVQINDVVDYAYSIKGLNPALGPNYSAWFAIGFTNPVDLVHVRLLAPASRTLNYQMSRTNIQPEITVRDELRQWRWEVKGAPAVIAEDMLPPGYNPYPTIQVSEFSQWNDVVAWATPLYSMSETLSPALQKLLLRWKKKKVNKEEFAVKALDFVQQSIRYSGADLFERSHRPVHPNQTFHQRYGDCKDKAQLLTAMLRWAGIQANAALVSNTMYKEIENGLPSPQLFNHIIVHAKIDGRSYWLEPTYQYQRGPLAVRGGLPYGRALIIKNGVGALSDIPVDERMGTSMHIDERFEVASPEQPVTVTVASSYSGRAAEYLRSVFTAHDGEQIRQKFLNEYAARYPSATLVSLTHSDITEKNEFNVTEKYLLPGFFSQSRGRYTARIFGWGIAPYIQVPMFVSRSMPVALPYPLFVTHHSEVLFSSANNKALPTEGLQIDSNIFSYSYLRTSTPERIDVQYSLKTRNDTVFPDSLDVYREEAEKLGSDSRYSFDITMGEK